MNIDTAIRELIRTTFRQNNLKHHTKGNAIYAVAYADYLRHSIEYYGKLLVTIRDATAHIVFYSQSEFSATGEPYDSVFAEHYIHPNWGIGYAAKAEWNFTIRPKYHQWTVNLELADPDFVDKLDRICQLIPDINKYPSEYKPTRFEGHENFILDTIPKTRYRECIYWYICKIVRKLLFLPGAGPEEAWYHACRRLTDKETADIAQHAVNDLQYLSQDALDDDTQDFER